ncbi:MAG TPA: hypothetical protein VFF98_14995 [Novosphingobium sp.]|nr:hypothetical protein [Novosphingobium sp.]
MGGYGSGRQGGRPTVDASRKIDLAWLLRTGRAIEGQRIAGVLHWHREGVRCGSIRYEARMDEPGQERLELFFTCGTGAGREAIHQSIRLTFTEPHYGGKRWWMICPFSGLRSGKLYLPDSRTRFASRKAWGLGYQSQRIAAGERPREALFRMQGRLGCPLGVGNWPVRPKGMWQRTYDRHLDRYEELERRAAADLFGHNGREPA